MSQEAWDQLHRDFAFSLAALVQHNKQYLDNQLLYSPVKPNQVLAT